MKKISILSLHLGYGGIEKSIAALVNILCKDFDVEIACTYKLYEKPSFEIDPRVKIKYLTDVSPNKSELKDAIKSKNIRKICEEALLSIKVLRLRKKTMIDYIKYCNSDVIIATRDIFDDWLSKYGNKKSLRIGWEHNHHHGNMKYAKRIVNSNKNLDYLVLVSNALCDYYSNEMSSYNCKCVYIPNIVDNMPSEISSLNKKKLISVGRLSREKGFDDLIRVFNKIHLKYPDWTLDIIGDGVEKDNLNNLINELNLKDKVILHGFRKKDYIDELLHDSSIYLMTSHTESFGIVLIEAMSHGVPCVAFDSAEGACELIEDNVNGYLIGGRSIDDYVSRVSQLIDSKKDRKRIGEAGLESCRVYSSDVVGKQWIDLIGKK